MTPAMSRFAAAAFLRPPIADLVPSARLRLAFRVDKAGSWADLSAADRRLLEQSAGEPLP